MPTELHSIKSCAMTDIVQHPRRPDVTFYASGRIDICCRAAKTLGLGKGDVIGIALIGGEYVLYVRMRAGEYEGRYQGTCFPTYHGKRRSNNFRTHYSDMAHAVIRACGRTGSERVKLYAGEVVDTECGTGLCLITRNPQ